MPTYPLAFPVSPGLEGAKMTLARRTSTATSPFTGSEQRSEWPFALWVVKATVPEIGVENAAAIRDWRAFIVELRGQAGTFVLPVPGIVGPSTNYSGTQGLVNGASQLGTSIITDTWTPNTPILNRGDYFRLGTTLKMCMADVSSNGSGQATIVFEPEIITAPANNSAVDLADPSAIMRMTSDTTSWDVRGPVLHTFSFEATEVK